MRHFRINTFMLKSKLDSWVLLFLFKGNDLFRNMPCISVRSFHTNSAVRYVVTKPAVKTQTGSEAHLCSGFHASDQSCSMSRNSNILTACSSSSLCEQRKKTLDIYKWQTNETFIGKIRGNILYSPETIRSSFQKNVNTHTTLTKSNKSLTYA